ncbi:hypothetical protein QMK17_03855 [Rhodococcus sp. G-MC3]|nr:hypothetical protein [Rhodococcus sp. G-MC3]MDJ0392467.1 hypothetical protein [Rhodococcus sp. G-MC3]
MKSKEFFLRGQGLTSGRDSTNRGDGQQSGFRQMTIRGGLGDE